MPLAANEFCQRLRHSGLLSAAECSSLSIDAQRSADELAQQLVAQAKLTSFQAETLLGDAPRPLVLDEYVLLAPLGAGGMGEVFKARHRQMDRLVALKMLPAKLVDSPDGIARFHREVKAAARLQHPNVVAVYDARADKDVHFYVMELVEGIDLAAMVKRRGPLPIAEAVEFTRQAAQGLAYAHEHDVIHRDIKPANLLLASGERKLPDSAAKRKTAHTQGADAPRSPKSHSAIHNPQSSKSSTSAWPASPETKPPKKPPTP